MKNKWLSTFWRWFLEALDKKDYQQALRLAECIQIMENE